MRISQVGIKNFRSLRDVSIEFDDVTTFIGPNGVGKSTVLRALDWFFNGAKGGSLTDKDVTFGNDGNDVRVEVVFSDLTSADRAELGKYAPLGSTSFTAWKIRKPSGDEYLSANARGLREFSPIKGAQGATSKKELYKRLRDDRPDLGLPIANTAVAIEAAIVQWEASNTALLEDVTEDLQTNFFGFNSNGKMSGLFDFVLVTADFRAPEEAQDSRASIIGRILERTIDRSAADDAISRLVESSRVQQQDIYRNQFSEDLSRLTKTLNGVLSSYSPGREVSVTPSDIELKAPRTTFSVSIADGDVETGVEGQGHGFQRTLLISSLQLLAQSSAAGAGGVICLAIEEPELFQHPIQAQAFARVLRALAEDSSQKIQVTYATHSPYFVEARHFDQVRRLTRVNGSSVSVLVSSSSVARVQEILGTALKASTIEKQLDGAVARQLPIAIFSNHVLLVEGTTEEAVFQGVADRKTVGHLETHGVSVVAAGGKGNILLIHGILDSLGIPVYTVFDADSGGRERSRTAGKDVKTIEADYKGNAKLNRDLLTYFKLPVCDLPPQTECEFVAILDDHLEAHLQAVWPEWSIACAEHESLTGNVLSKNHAAYRNVTREAGGIPSDLVSGIVDRVSIASVQA